MKESSWMGLIGVWSFVVGLVITLLIAIFRFETGYTPVRVATLSILGLIVGLINITDKEVMLYLLSTIALLLSANSLMSILSYFEVSNIFELFLQGVIVFIAPGAAVVSMRALYDVAKG